MPARGAALRTGSAARALASAPPIISSPMCRSRRGRLFPAIGRSAKSSTSCRRLDAAGYCLALPYVDKKRHVLIFRDWRPGTAMIEGPFRIPEPTEAAAEITPTLLLVPLLAYDADGFRLGYGGGYYDKALAALRAAGGPVLAVGMAFAEQMVERVPHGDWDERLEWIVTERGAMPFGEAAGEEAT
jgi:5-formyltetrahydrofolate cyclo-ligase